MSPAVSSKNGGPQNHHYYRGMHRLEELSTEDEVGDLRVMTLLAVAALARDGQIVGEGQAGLPHGLRRNEERFRPSSGWRRWCGKESGPPDRG